LDLLLAECSASNCLPPYNVVAQTNETSTAVTLEWSTISGGQVDLQLRLQSNSNWTEIMDVTSGVVIDTLQSCAMYEYRLRVACDTTMSDWGDTYYFSTSGCCYHPQNFTISGVSEQAHYYTYTISGGLGISTLQATINSLRNPLR
jgi:hypothetical protein